MCNCPLLGCLLLDGTSVKTQEALWSFYFELLHVISRNCLDLDRRQRLNELIHGNLGHWLFFHKGLIFIRLLLIYFNTFLWFFNFKSTRNYHLICGILNFVRLHWFILIRYPRSCCRTLCSRLSNWVDKLTVLPKVHFEFALCLVFISSNFYWVFPYSVDTGGCLNFLLWRALFYRLWLCWSYLFRDRSCWLLNLLLLFLLFREVIVHAPHVN